MCEAVREQNLYMEHANVDYKFIRFADCSIFISEDGCANITASLKSTMSSDTVNISLYLQRYDGDWTTIKKWEKKCTSLFCFFSEEIDVNKDFEYRIEVYYTASKGAFTETLKTVESAD